MEEVLTLTMVVWKSVTTNDIHVKKEMWYLLTWYVATTLFMSYDLCSNKKKFIEKKLVDIVRSVITYTSTENTVLWRQYLIKNAKLQS